MQSYCIILSFPNKKDTVMGKNFIEVIHQFVHVSLAKHTAKSLLAHILLFSARVVEILSNPFAMSELFANLRPN